MASRLDRYPAFVREVLHKWMTFRQGARAKQESSKTDVVDASKTRGGQATRSTELSHANDPGKIR